MNKPAGQPNTDHYVDSYFSCESKTVALGHTKQLLPYANITCFSVNNKMGTLGVPTGPAASKHHKFQCQQGTVALGHQTAPAIGKHHKFQCQQQNRGQHQTAPATSKHHKFKGQQKTVALWHQTTHAISKLVS